VEAINAVGRRLDDVYLVAFARTAFTRFSRREPQRDDFWDLRPEELVAVVVKTLLERTGVKPEAVDDLLTSTALPVGEQWLYGGRHVVFAAKLPYTIPAAHIDRQCASSITTVGFGAMEIATGMADIVIAGGVEKMSKTPMYENPNIEIRRGVRQAVQPPHRLRDGAHRREAGGDLGHKAGGDGRLVPQKS
jgi:acetyl-CoA acetyltransferase